MTKKLAWSSTEDNRLTKLIESRRICTKRSGICTINASWGEIAELMPNRSAKQCRERWCYNLNPAIKKDIWTLKEDAVLMKAQSILGNQWALIARYLPGRTENSVKTRHKSIVRAKKRAWTEEEDEVILSMHRQIGSRWEKIAERLPHRTSNGVKTRFAMLRKGQSHISPIEGSPEQILYHPALIEEIDLEISLKSVDGRTKRRRNFFNIPATEMMEQYLDPVEIEVGILLADIIHEIALQAGEESPRITSGTKRKRREIPSSGSAKKMNSKKFPSQRTDRQMCGIIEVSHLAGAQQENLGCAAQPLLESPLQNDSSPRNYPLYYTQGYNHLTFNHALPASTFRMFPSTYPQSFQSISPLHHIMLLNHMQCNF